MICPECGNIMTRWLPSMDGWILYNSYWVCYYGCQHLFKTDLDPLTWTFTYGEE